MPRSLLKQMVGRCRTEFPAFGLMALAAAGASAQSEGANSAGARTFSIVPSISATETFTSNAELTPNHKENELITQIAPGLRITRTSGRLRGSLDYALNAVVYARHGDKTELQHALSATAFAEAIENWAFVDASATVSRQAISAFGTQAADSTRVNGNQTQVATYSIAPYVRGRLAGAADYEVRVATSATHADAGSSFGTTASEASARLTGATGFTSLGWSASTSYQVFDYESSGTGKVGRSQVGLDYAVTPDIRASASGGRESNSVLAPEDRDATTYGGGVTWRPSERTVLSAQAEHRAFGSTYNVRFEHRSPRSVWSFTNVRDLSTGNGLNQTGQLGTVYDLLFTQFASQQPDPSLRAQLVNNFLLANGLTGSTTVPGGFLTSAVTLQTRQELSFALLGLRDTVTFIALRSGTHPVGDATQTVDDFAVTSAVRQTGFTADWAHRLTPQSSLNVLASWLKSSGSDDAQRSTLRSVVVNWTGRVSRSASVSLGARRSLFDSDTVPYNETSLFGTARLEF